MIGAERAKLGRQLGPASGRALVGVQTDWEPCPAGGGEDGPHLVRAESERLAESVHHVDEPRLGGSRDHGFGHQSDIAGPVVGIFRRQRVRAQERAHHLDRAFAAELAGDAEHPELGFEVQAIAGLDLDGGDAFGDQAVEPLQRRTEKRRLAGCARGAHGGKDAATGRGDVFVAGPRHALLELIRAIAGEDQMGVAVDQARRHQPALQLDDLGRVHVGRQVGQGTGEGDAAARGADGAVGDQPQSRPGRRQGGQHPVSPQPVEPHCVTLFSLGKFSNV